MKSKKIFMRLPLLLMGLFLVFAISLNAQQTGTFKDPRDGKTYKTVKIGNQIWMAENLAFKPKRGNYWASDNNQANVEKYGYLYDWQTAINVCPIGWHLPSDDEWTELINYLGGANVAGGKLKAGGTIEAGSDLWDDPNIGATNETGFTALPGGRVISGKFLILGYTGYWWSSSKSSGQGAWYRILYYDCDNIRRKSAYKISGLSVRCLRD